MTDIKPMANIAPFGLCKSLANPTVAAATAAAGGKLQKMPCIPCVTSPWAYGKTDVLVKGQPALMNDSRCVCMWLGLIKVKNVGQKSVIDTAPPPFIAEEPEPPTAVAATAPQAKDGETNAAGAPTPKKSLISSIQTAVTTAIKKAVDAVKERVAAVASAIAAAVAAIVAGIFGLRGKRDDAKAAAPQDAAPVETGERAGTTEMPPDAVPTVKTEITAKLIRNHFGDKRTLGAFEYLSAIRAKTPFAETETLIR